MQQRMLDDSSTGGDVKSHSSSSDSSPSKGIPFAFKFAFLGVLILGIIGLIFLLVLLSKDHAMPGGSNGTIPVQVKIDLGTIEGFQKDDVVRFLGIPFAAPPTGSLRWTAPTHPTPLSGHTVYQAKHFKPVCPQPMLPLVGVTPPEQSEDCLYLNVYTPANFSVDSKYAVLFWIHGGGYIMGSGGVSQYDGGSLVENGDGLVVVTINYRLGVFGFLTLDQLRPNQTVSVGNYGVQDMLFALRWVQNNIAQFGGDPTKVTIWGESAGCDAVLALITATGNDGLFRGAMCDSGGYADVAMPYDQALSQGAFLVNAAGCAGSSNVQQCLLSKSANELVLAYSACFPLPVIDGVLFPKSPEDLVSDGTFAHVPLLMGVNLDEGSLFATQYFPPNWNGNYTEAMYFIGESMGFDQATSEELLELYPLTNYPSPYWGFTDLFGDQIFKCGSRRWLKKTNLAVENLPIYTYYFVYPDTPNVLFPSQPTWGLGAYHGAELPWVWQTDLYNIPSNMTSWAQLVQHYWVYFTQNGAENPAWPQWTWASPSTLYINLTMSIGSGFWNETKCEFWDAHDKPAASCQLS